MTDAARVKAKDRKDKQWAMLPIANPTLSLACWRIGIPKASSGFGVGWSGRSSFAKLGSAHVEGSVSSATLGGRFGRRQPMKQGSCFQR
jgi:hypothetical protein